MTGRPAPTTPRRARSAVHAVAIVTVAATLMSATLYGALTIRLATARALRSPEQVAADWEYGLWRWIGNIDAANGLYDADPHPGAPPRPPPRVLKRETTSAAQDVGGALSVQFDWTLEGAPVGATGSTVTFSGTATLTLSGFLGRRIGLAWQARESWTLTLDRTLGQSWRVCHIERSGTW